MTFDYRRDIPHGETDDRFLVLASSDGVNFTQIGNIGATGNGSFVDGDYQAFAFDLTSFISDHTTIRFSVGDDVDDGDVVYVDNITFASAATFTENGDPVSLGIATQITDVDNLDMQSASIVLTNSQDGDDFVIAGAPAGSSGNTGIGGITYTVTRAAGSIRSRFWVLPASLTIKRRSMLSSLPTVRRILRPPSGRSTLRSMTVMMFRTP